MKITLPDGAKPLVAIDLKKKEMMDFDKSSTFSTVLCVGNFDGVHKGHRELIKHTLDCAENIRRKNPKINILSGAWFFSLPTRQYTDKAICPVLTTTEEKLDLLRDCGLDIAFVAFFPYYRNMLPSDFVKNMLERDCLCKTVVCGYNFRYGIYGSGNAETLKNSFCGMTDVVECVDIEGVPISSSTVRALISEGNVRMAAKMLTTPYKLTDVVQSGKKIGRTIGFPTANQFFEKEKIIPAFGVYATRVTVGAEKYIGVSNVGIRPTVKNDNELPIVNCETYILDFDGDLYGKCITVEFIDKLRREIKFNSTDELRNMISKDVEQARKRVNLEKNAFKLK